MANIDILLEHPESMKSWLSKPEAREFNKFLAAWLESTDKVLHGNDDLISIYRAQGESLVLRRLLGLNEEVNKYLRAFKADKKLDGRK